MVWLAILLVCCARAFALDPSLDVSQYAHTAWKTRDGLLKSQVFAMTQTLDGYLWLGTESGLVRFDGVRFVNWQPPAGQGLPGGRIRDLFAASDGALWIGTDEGLASWKEGRITQYPELAGQLVVGLLQDRTGTVWASGQAVPSGRLCAIRDEKARCYGSDGSLGTGISRLLQDRAGNLWAVNGKRLWRWSPGSPKMYSLTDFGQDLAEDENGQVLVSTRNTEIKEIVGDEIRSYVVPRAGRQTKFDYLLLDHNGAKWLGTVDHGIFHVHSGATDNFSQTDGLTGNWVRGIFEDREGSIWVATSDGLDRFREFSFPTMSAKQGLSPSSVSSVLAAKDGSIWMGTYAGLNRWTEGKNTVFVHERIPGSVEREVVDAGLLDNYIESLWEDPEHKIWVFTRRGLAVFENGHFKSEAGLQSDIGWVYSIAGQGGTGAWVSTDRALFRVRNQRTAERLPWQELGKIYPAVSLMLDPSGGVYLGFEKGGLVYFKDGAVQFSYGEKDGLGKGHVFDVYMDRGGAVWATTQSGLSRVSGGHVATLSSKNGLPCDSALWMRKDDTGAAWLYMSCGLVHIAPSDLQGWVTDPNKVISSRVYDASDGIATHATSTSSSPNVTMSNDGKLWFTTWDGVTVIDPHHLAFNKLPPPVHIEQIVADGKTYDLSSQGSGGMHLPPRVRDLAIDYTALSLVVPEKVRFRFKLEGQDADWREVVNQRRVEYSNLPPRHYRFRVMACNNSGVWNEEGAFLDFAIAPAFYQTNWFRALCLLTFMAMVWTIYKVRVHALERRQALLEQHQIEIRALNEQMIKAQEAERMRISGDLHDGVLQQITSLTLRLGTVKRRVPADSEARAEIVGLQQELIQIGTDIRHISHELHPALLQEAGLPAALSSYCEEFSKVRGLPVSCKTDESVQELSPGAALCLYRIAQEALGNASKYSQAKKVEVRLTRADGRVCLSVSDDGVGCEPDQIGQSGGLGVINMRERVLQLHGTFEFDSAPGRGTTVRAEVPFRPAS